MLRILLTLAALLLSVTGAQADTVILHGSSTVTNAVMLPHKAQIEKASGEVLDVVSNGSGRGLADLLAGKADIAMISAPLAAEVAAANASAPGSIDPARLVPRQIGEAQVAFVVHPTNPVTSLTLTQLTAILSGKITNWRDVGGRDEAIAVVAAGRGDGVRSAVESKLLGGASISAPLRELPNAPQIAKVAAQLPAALGVTSAASVRPDVHVLKTDQSIGQPLILVTLGAASPHAAKVIDAASAAAGE